MMPFPNRSPSFSMFWTCYNGSHCSKLNQPVFCLVLTSICPFSNGYRRLPPKSVMTFGPSHWIFLSSKWFDIYVMALDGPSGDRVTALPGHSELLWSPNYKLFEKGTNRLCCPMMSCLFSVSCPGWFVKHVFRLIGSHIHLDPQPCPGSASPILWVYPLWAFWSAAHSNTPSQSDSFLTECTCSIANSFCFLLQNCWAHFMFGKMLFLNWVGRIWMYNRALGVGF